jgi:hypothetical protein
MTNCLPIWYSPLFNFVYILTLGQDQRLAGFEIPPLGSPVVVHDHRLYVAAASTRLLPPLFLTSSSKPQNFCELSSILLFNVRLFITFFFFFSRR